jgi:O-methyltransferase
MVESVKTTAVWQAVENTVQGDHSVAEVGVFRGGSSRFIAASFKQSNRFPAIHVFDTFEGHPDIVDPARDHHPKGWFSETSCESVKKYLSPFPNLQIHVGNFAQTRHKVADCIFGLFHINVDIYRSTVDCLEFFWPRICSGGIVVVDDYGFLTCRGLKEAVAEFLNCVPDCQSWYMHTGQLVLQKRFPDET